MARLAALTHRPNVVFALGQSNMGCTVTECTDTWPPRVAYDPNVGYYSEFCLTQGSLRYYPRQFRGSYVTSLAMRMRDAGLRPWIAHEWINGCSAGMLLDATPGFIAGAKPYIDALQNPVFSGIIISQGETTSADWIAKTAAYVALLRAAFSATMHLYIMRLNPLLTTALQEQMKLDQDALGASDPHATVIDFPDPGQVQIPDTIHYNRHSLDIQTDLTVKAMLVNGIA
jgi:hypothetical protein